MGHGREIDLTVTDASGAQTSPAFHDEFFKMNVTSKYTQEMTINMFPNGVKFGTGDGAQMIEPPVGGKVVATADGGMDVFDARHRKVAELDSERTMHVHTKNGEYTETKDGHLVFQPIGKTTDLSTLHKRGEIPPSKLENYGVSTDGKTTRFPNGVNYEARTGRIVIPAEYPNFQEERVFDEHHNLSKRIGLNGDGGVLYTIDNKGIHVPTADGTISQSHNGTVRFDAPTPQGKHSQKKSIDDELKKMMDECADSYDPLCGLDLNDSL